LTGSIHNMLLVMCQQSGLARKTKLAVIVDGLESNVTYVTYANYVEMLTMLVPPSCKKITTFFFAFYRNKH